MKKMIFSGLAMGLLVAMGACSGGNKAENTDEGGAKQDPAKDFALIVARQVSANQLDSLRAIYPDAAKADSLALQYDEAAVTVQPGADGTYVVTFSPTASATLKDAGNGQYTISSSKGLFAYPTDVISPAREYGQYDATLTDAENADRMKDEGFNKWLGKQAPTAKVKAKLNDKDLFEGIEFTLVVTNGMDVPLDAGDYSVSVVEDNGGEIINHKFNGKALGPGAKSTFYQTAGSIVELYNPKLKWNLSPEQLAAKYAKPTGGEYAKYLQTK